MIDPNRIARLAAIERQYGLPSSTLAGMYGIESNFGRAKDRPGSQFQGGFQLGNAVRRQYGITNPQDFEQSAMGAAMYARDNAKFLRSKLGRDPTPADLYLAHQQGPGGAVKLLSHPDTPAGMLTNPNFIRSNAGDPNAPAAAFTKMFGDKFSSKAAMAAQGSPMGEAMAYTNEPPVNRGAAIDAINAMAGGPSQDPLAGSAGSLEETPDTGWEAAGNIGNGLMMAGAALMARDNPAGAQALMAGIRAKQKAEKKNWKMDFDPKSGQMIRYSPDTGEMSTSMVPGYKPPAADDEKTVQQRNLEYMRSLPPGPERDAFRKIIGIDDDDANIPALNPEGLEAATELYVRSGGKMGMVGLNKADKTAITNNLGKWAKEHDMTMGDVIANGPKMAGYMAQERDMGVRYNRMSTAKTEMDATLKTLEEKAKALPPDLINGTVPWNAFMQKSAELWNKEGRPELASYRETIQNVSNAYATLLARGATNVPVAMQKRAEELFNSNMSPATVQAVTSTMRDTSDRMMQGIKWSQENLRAEIAGKSLPHPKLEEEIDAFIEEKHKARMEKESAAKPEAPKQTQAPEGMPSGARQDASGVWWAPQPNGKWRKVIINQTGGSF